MDFIKVEAQGRVTTITLNRPEVMNAIHSPMHLELQAAFDAYAADDGQHLCVVTGAGDKAFCAGSDLKALAAGMGSAAFPPGGYAGLIERFDLNKPVIAAVNGLALGGGFEVVLACDIVIAAPTASFGLPEPLVGAIAVGGGLHRLPRQIGLKRAMGMILTSRRVSAEEGERLGFVNEVAPAGALDATVKRWCDQILQGSPMALRASKEAITRGLAEPDLQQAIQRQGEHPAYIAWREGPDAREGSRAFAEKRPPNWRGR